MSQEKKQKLAGPIKAILKKYGIKATLAVDNHSSLELNIKEGAIDFIGSFNRTASKHPRYNNGSFDAAKTYLSVNTYWYYEHFDGEALAFLKEVIAAMNDGNHDNSDIQSDYFDVGWYIHVNIGKWNKPYNFVE